jgi:Tfp pilus assembly protein PilF
MLLERGMAQDALAAFEATLAKEPNRLGATIGAAQAAEKLGDAEKARRHYAKALELAAGGDAGRADLAQARSFMAKN